MVEKAKTQKTSDIDTSTQKQPMSEAEALKVAKGFGIDIDAILESRVAAAVNKVLTDSHLADIVPVMQAKMDATDKKLTDLTQLLTSLAEKAQAGQAALAQAPGGQSSDGMNLLAALLRGGQGGGDNLDSFMKRMIEFQTLSASMWQNPLAQAGKMILDMQAGMYRNLQATPEQVVKGTQDMVNRLAVQANEPKPNP